jgi:hypothetical protein
MFSRYLNAMGIFRYMFIFVACFIGALALPHLHIKNRNTLGECPRVSADVHIQRIEILNSQLGRATDHRGGHLAASVQSTAPITHDPDPSTTYEIVFCVH